MVANIYLTGDTARPEGRRLDPAAECLSSEWFLPPQLYGHSQGSWKELLLSSAEDRKEEGVGVEAWTGRNPGCLRGTAPLWKTAVISVRQNLVRQKVFPAFPLPHLLLSPACYTDQSSGRRKMKDSKKCQSDNHNLGHRKKPNGEPKQEQWQTALAVEGPREKTEVGGGTKEQKLLMKISESFDVYHMVALLLLAALRNFGKCLILFQGFWLRICVSKQYHADTGHEVSVSCRWTV